MGTYLYLMPISDAVGLVIIWCLSSFVAGDGYRRDELVELYLGEIVSIAIGFFPIVNDLVETGSPGGLVKLL